MRILDEIPRGCDSPICDFCKWYIDASTKSQNRRGFAGHGHCAIDYEETDAWMGCDEYFVCIYCQDDILEHWSCL